jgi:uncharacterized repeat protein (TIGR03803 family)
MTRVRARALFAVLQSRRLRKIEKSGFGFLQTLCLILLFCGAITTVSPAQTIDPLVSFDSANGESPSYTALVQGSDSYLYGTTSGGGANGDGTVFKISTAGDLITLHSFDVTDGESPEAGLALATNGAFYGTTSGGGANGDGTVFKISTAGKLITLHSFAGADGAYSTAVLLQAANGDFYGTTEYGGAHLSDCGGRGCGTVFKMTAAGKLTTLYSFCVASGCADGAQPVAGLVLFSNGNFYGTTSSGGANGDGTVFEITPNGALTTLYSFCSLSGCADGAQPMAGLLQANGNFYGTTYAGGANGLGTIFNITSQGALTTLHSFVGTDGEYPTAGLLQATDGNLYGTTDTGGINFEGNIFNITPTGTLTNLYSFCSQTGCVDGSAPLGGLVQHTNGNVYGATQSGGSSSECGSGCGTVFSLSMGLGPFVETVPASGTVGQKVSILGNNLKGATSVTFNGTPATFKVFSPYEISTSVPDGASSGTVTVTTPKGVLNSNRPFQLPPTSGTWTWLQDISASLSANQYSGIEPSCSTGANSCTFEILPTTSGSARVVGVITTNSVTISSAYDCTNSSGCTAGNASDQFSLCSSHSCHIVNHAIDNVDAAYLGGSTAPGAHYVTINLSGASSGSYFYVYFAELMPPAGTTAALDAVATAASSGCTSCKGPLPNISSTDAVFMVTDSVYPLLNFNSPWSLDFIGSVTGLNVASAATAPAFDAQGGFFTMSAIAFQSSAGLFAPPSPLFSQVNLTPNILFQESNGTPTVRLSLNASTGSGHLLFLQASTTAGQTISAVSGGGTWVIPAACQNSSIAQATISCAYVLSSDAGTEDLSVTMSDNCDASCAFAYYETARSSGSFSLDTAASTYNSTASATPNGQDLTLSGSNDVIFQQIGSIATYVFDGSLYPYPEGTRFLSPVGGGRSNGNTALVINSTNGTAPAWLLSSSVPSVVSAVAFK